MTFGRFTESLSADLNWLSVPNRSYVVYMTSTDPALPNSEWKAVGTTTKRHFTITELESGKPYWFQVAAVNAAGEGPTTEPMMSRAA